VIRPDQHDVTESTRDQLSSAQKKSPNEDLAQFRVDLHECQKLIAVDFDHFAGFPDAKRHEGPAAGEQGDLARELAGSKRRHCRLDVAGQIHGLYTACADDEELRSRLPSCDEYFTARDGPHSTMNRDALDLLGRQFWKSMIDVRCGS
jgi:hypothetical protein